MFPIFLPNHTPILFAVSPNYRLHNQRQRQNLKNFLECFHPFFSPYFQPFMSSSLEKIFDGINVLYLPIDSIRYSSKWFSEWLLELHVTINKIIQPEFPR